MVYKLEMSDVFNGNAANLKLPYCSDEDFDQRLEHDGLWTPLITKAVEQTRLSHAGRTRDSGGPFLNEHIYPVTIDVLDYMKRRKKPVTKQEVVVAAALLHYTVEEDYDNEFAQISDAFNHQVDVLVNSVSRYNVGDQELYINKLYNADKYAKVIKILEVINNLHCSIVLVDQLPEKLATYSADAEADYLPIANTILDYDPAHDKELYERLKSLIDIGRMALSNAFEAELE
jgi:(p)ppGpp synthase/HD superfamily hydrolase